MAKRSTSLQDFQMRLARRLADAASRPLSADWLGVSWQGVHALLPLAHAGEIARPSYLQRLPHTPPWVQGVTGLRGGLAVVVDWVRLLGLQEHTTAARHDEDRLVYWIGLNPAIAVNAALCVDQLLGLRSARDLQTTDSAAPLPAAVRQRWRDEQGRCWHELDLVLMVQSPVFLNPCLPAFGAAIPT